MKEQQPKYQQEFIDAVKKSAATQAYFCSDRDLNPDLGPESFFHNKDEKIDHIIEQIEDLELKHRVLAQDPQEISAAFAGAADILENEGSEECPKPCSIVHALYESHYFQSLEKHVDKDACYILSVYLGLNSVWEGLEEISKDRVDAIKKLRHAAEITK